MKTNNNKWSSAIGFLLLLAVTLLLTMTNIWQGILAVGLVAGISAGTKRRGFLYGFCIIAVAWALSMLLMNKWVLLDQVAQIIIGDSGMGPVFFLIISLLGGLLGALSGVTGAAFRLLVQK